MVSIAGYARISVDEELGADNPSIENQKAIISEYAATARAIPLNSARAIRPCAPRCAPGAFPL